MAGFIKVNAKRVETTELNTKVNKEVFDEFKVRCKRQGYPMNVILESFMQQYKNGRFEIAKENIEKWKGDPSDTDTLNTTFNKEIYLDFKRMCKDNGYFVKYVIIAFMELYAKHNLVLGFVDVNSTVSVKGDILLNGAMNNVNN